MAFLVIQGEKVKLLPVEHNCTIDKVLDYIPELCEKAEKLLDKLMKKEEKTEEIKVQKPIIKKTNINYEYKYNEPDETEEDNAEE